eukprot:7047586-Pyramimonas_sp.AAC.1
MLVTRAGVAVHIGNLLRHAHAPCWKHVRHLNSVVRWIKRKNSSLVYYSVPLPWSVVGFPDSAFSGDRAGLPSCESGSSRDCWSGLHATRRTVCSSRVLLTKATSSMSLYFLGGAGKRG